MNTENYDKTVQEGSEILHTNQFLQTSDHIHNDSSNIPETDKNTSFRGQNQIVLKFYALHPIISLVGSVVPELPYYLSKKT